MLNHLAAAYTPIAWPLWVGALTAFALSVLVVLNTRWHGFLSLDASQGVQKLHAHLTPRVGGLPTPAPESVRYPVMFDDMPAPTLRVYPRYTVVAEKLEAIISLGMANSRMKDYFDL